MRVLFSTIVFLVIGLSQGFAQGMQHSDFGIEVQQYPTGFLFGLQAELGLGRQHGLNIRLGYNSLDHKDFGVHDTEQGGGLGGSLAYHYYFKGRHSGLFAGPRADLWFNRVTWTDAADPQPLAGTSNVIVLQPTVKVGYTWIFKENFLITPTLAAGVELNIHTNGEEVGQGAILLWGISLASRISKGPKEENDLNIN